jgi:hypothetical protein
MLRLIPAAAPTSVVPYAVAMATGFFIGVLGHINKNRTLIVTGIVIVGAVSAFVLFAVAKIA